MALLEIHELRKSFYGLEVLAGVDIAVEANQIVGLIGPNGSGKSTLFNCVTGIHKADRGRITFDGADISNRAPNEISLAGLTRSFQMVQIYPEISVLDNLLIAVQEHQERNFVGRILRSKAVREAERQARARAAFALGEFGLEAFSSLPAGILSYGQRKLVEFAAALMPDPKLVLLDEPAAAVNPSMINQMKAHIRRFQGLGKTVFLVEHNMNFVMDICDTVIVLDQGRKIVQGDPETVQRDERVIEAYFGR